MYIVKTSTVSSFNSWNSITSVQSPFIGIEYWICAGVNFRLLCCEVFTMADVYINSS
jgi:hypothetical protein